MQSLTRCETDRHNFAPVSRALREVSVGHISTQKDFLALERIQARELSREMNYLLSSSLYILSVVIS